MHKEEKVFVVKLINNGYLVSFNPNDSYWFFPSKKEIVEFISNELNEVFRGDDG